MISVLLSVYNGKTFIAEAVKSILHQTYRDFELIIIDDGSSDGTTKVLDQFHDPRIKRLSHEKNFGLVQSLNRAASVAGGAYLARMDADDVSDPRRFEKQVSFLERHPEVGVVATAAVQIDRHGKGISTLVMPETHELIFWHFFFDLPIVHPTVMMRSDLFHVAGGYHPFFAHSEDMELWGRLLFRTRFYNLQDILYQRRLHEKSIGSTKSKIQITQTTTIRQRIFSEMFGWSASERVARWFADPFHTLSLEEKKELMRVFFILFDYVMHTFQCDTQTVARIREDLLRRIRIADHSHERALRKYIFRMLRDVLPMTIRHRLKTSKLGSFFAKRI